MRKVLLGIVISLSVASITYCQNWPLEFDVELDKQVYLFLSQKESKFNPSEVNLNITGVNVGGIIDICLNDEKIGSLKGGGIARCLLLKEDKNVIKIKGTSKENMHIMIAAYEPIVEDGDTIGYKNGYIIVKKVLTPQQLEDGLSYILNGK